MDKKVGIILNSMPKHCGECPLNYDCCKCIITGGNILCFLGEGRHDDCPLVEVEEDDDN